jgi:hypothetical protein
MPGHGPPVIVAAAIRVDDGERLVRGVTADRPF